MKKIKEISDKHDKEYKKLFKYAMKQRAIYHKKYNFEKLSFNAQKKIWKIYHNKYFVPAEKVKEKFLKTRLIYINSPEYASSEYKNDSKKYKKLIVYVNKHINNLKNIYSKAKLKGDKEKMVSTKSFIKCFSYYIKTYNKKPRHYTKGDVDRLFLNPIYRKID